jgi:hypothetical protein
VSRPARERERYPRRSRAPSWAPIAIAVLVILAVLYAVGTLGTSSNSTTTGSHRALAHHHRTHNALPKTTSTTPAPPTKVTLRMVPTAAVYVCLVNGAGTKLINEQTFAVGQTIPTETGSKLLLTLGNNSVQLKVNGRLVPVVASPTAIRLLITPTAVRHIPASQTPTCP